MDARIRNIVVGVATLAADDPASVDPVLGPAVELARSLNATLHVVHVYELPYALVNAYASYVPAMDPEVRQHYCEDVLHRLEAQVARFPYPKLRCHSIEGSAGRSLVELANREKADLIVVGATRRGRLWRNLLGTTADRVIRGSGVPVLVLHQPFGGPVRRVLLTTDLSPESAVLHDRGADTAAALFGGSLEMRTLMVVWFDTLLPPPLKEDALKDAAENELAEFVAARPRGGRLQARVRFGEVSREVAREAEEWGAQLIVLGTHGRSGFSRLALGSTAAATLRAASCNVLVVPRAAARVEVEVAERAPAMAIGPAPALAH